MKRLLALLLVLVMLVSATSILTACQKVDDNPSVSQPEDNNTPETPDKLVAFRKVINDRIKYYVNQK